MLPRPFFLPLVKPVSVRLVTLQAVLFSADSTLSGQIW